MVRRLCFSLVLFATTGTLAQTLQTYACKDPVMETDRQCLRVEGVDFSGRSLEGIDFSRAAARGALFLGATGRHVVFIEADLSDTSFVGAVLYGANFYGAVFRGADLRGADLRGSNFWAADLSEAVIDDSTQLNGAGFDAETLLPLKWGETPANRRTEATRRGMVPVRE